MYYYRRALAFATAVATTLALSGTAFAQQCQHNQNCPPPTPQPSAATPVIVSSGALQSYAEIGAPVAIGAAVNAGFGGLVPGGGVALYNLDADHTGAAAGDGGRQVLGWISGSGGHANDGHIGLKSELSSVAAAVGLQTMLTPTFLIGLSATTDASFGNIPGLREDSGAHGFSPYVGYAFAPGWNAFGSFGWSDVGTTLKSAVVGGGAGTPG